MHPIVPVGFDYARAILEIRQFHTYDQIAEFCGFTDKAIVSRIASGKEIPRHPQGEALWVLYVNEFGQKPPMPKEKAVGTPFVAPVKRHSAIDSR